MVRISNTVIGVLNILTLLLSILVVGTSIWFRVQGSSECQRFLYVPLLALGLFLLVVSLLGLIGSFCQVRWMFWIYLFVLFVLIVGMFCFSIFAVVVTNRGVGKAISGRGYKEYRLGDYSHWLQKNVVNGRNWEKFKSCLIDTQVCPTLGNDVNQQASHFYKKNLSPIQSGCCKPPTYCGFIYKNATFWTVPESGPAVPDSDCTTWSNNQETLCYDCKSCKAGVLANFMNKWRKIAIFNTSIFIFLIVVYSIGCCASRNNQARKSYKKYRGY